MSQSALKSHITETLKRKPILLMSHLVLGYPSVAENHRVIDAMVANGVDMMELQIPFSEPSADGETIARANQSALDLGFKVDQAFEMFSQVTARHQIPFLIMTYFNIMLARGIERFIADAASSGIRGLIIPDLPLEEAGEAMALAKKYGLDWIQLLTPTTPVDRLVKLGAAAEGFTYCVARKGVTGKETNFDELGAYLKQCRKAAPSLPLALGFGVRRKADVDALVGQADIAIIGTEGIRIHENEGAEAVGAFFGGLRE
ncbi:MAG: tryptophan synthase subunit alpha [Magnetococcales bacterium]|nr:tryptophan synthase subunit alpha [Magnetococcales bacterium]